MLARRPLLAVLALSLLFLSVGCSDRDPTSLDIARARIDPVVFDDAYSDDVYFQPFFETNYFAAEVDSVYAFGGFTPDGARSLRIDVAPQGAGLGAFSGGVLTSGASRDLADFNALTFYARSNVDIALDVVGFGNDNTGTSLYEAGRGGLALTQEWTFFVVPIPGPAKLIAERGMFTFAESLEQQPPGSGVFPYPDGYSIWLDEIRFAELDNVNIFRANMRSLNSQYFIGSTVSVDNTSTIFEIDGGFVPVEHSANYFDYTSSDVAVAKVVGGAIRVVGEGQASITATLGEDDVFGSITVTGNPPPPVPATGPTQAAANVISLFSDAYASIPVETWRANWGGSTTVLGDYVVGSDNTKMYASLNFVGIVFQNSPVDLSTKTHLHMDVYAPAGTDFKVKLGSFPPGENGVETPDLVLNGTTTPSFGAGEWSSLDIPLADFALPGGWDWGHIGQMVLSTSDARLVLLDNIYWYGP